MGVTTAAIYAVIVVRSENLRNDLSDGDRAVRDAHQAMVDQETGLRAYLVSGDADFLQPYDAGRRHLDESDRIINARLGGDKKLAPLLLQMRVAQRLWID